MVKKQRYRVGQKKYREKCFLIPQIPLDSKINTPALSILLEAPAVGFIEQSADKITLEVTDIISLLNLLDSIFKAYPVYPEHCRF